MNLLPNAIVYLAAAVVCVPLAKRLGLGAVLGYLVAGVVIGPWGLRLVSDVESIMHLAEFGVVLMLFLIGLELDPKRLWAMRRDIFGGGSLQMLLCSGALAIPALLLGLSWQAALVVGLGLAMSSTAIALQTLAERNLMGTPVGRHGLGILLFQDIAAIPVLALLPLLGSAAASAPPGLQGSLRILGAVTLVVVLGRFLVRPCLRAIARSEVREVFTAFALLLVLGIAALMQAVELSMALGAFLAGVLLAESEYRHALEVDLEPFKGLLLGLFFISVGMSVDFGVLLRLWPLVLALTTLFLLLKGAALWLLARRLDLPRSQHSLFALLLVQGGEFAFVVFSQAGQAQIWQGDQQAVAVLVVALSMLASPLLLVGYDRWLAPRWAQQTPRPADTIDDQHHPVIIAGFGRFGQIVGRLLYAQRIGVTVLDNDPDHIEVMRRFGFKVFYGDATREDLLAAAGAAQAKLMVVAIDNVDDSLQLIDHVRQHYPKLQIIARARNVTHYFNLLERGVTLLERETFESALLVGRHALQTLGWSGYEARKAALKFRDHNIRTLHELLPHRRDQKKLVSLAKQAREELDALFEEDRAAREQDSTANWGEK